MPTLGERIKGLRKKRKLTLEALAGDQLTKGMLSLIENDKAKPSMESLTYIASRLNVETNELLESFSFSDLRDILEQADKEYKEDNYQWIVEHLNKPLGGNLPLCFETAKLMELYGKASYNLHMKKWDTYIKKADELFISLNFFNQSAQVTLFLVWTKMNDRLYKEALVILKNKKQMFDIKSADLDLLTELDFRYYEIGLLFAIGDYNKASERLRETISLSIENKVLYRIEEFYRVAYFYASMKKEENDMSYYFGKISLLVDFTEDLDSKLNLIALKIYYYNSYVKEYDKALELIEVYRELADNELDYFYVMEKGKALYGKRNYQEALDFLLKFEERTYWNHPFDLTFMYEVFSYRARCYQMLGQMDQAYREAKYAMDRIESMPDTPFTQFIKNTYKSIKSSYDTK